jgi:O-antigen ligase
VLFALVGLAELADHSHLLFNRGLDQDAYFIRINSFFYDPNVYGRYLALTIVLVACVSLRRRRILAREVAILGLLWAGLLISLSESAMIALLAGLAVAWVMSARRPGRGAVALVLAVAIAVGLTFAFARGSIPTSLGGTSGSLAAATSGRTSLVTEGVDLFADRPLEGFGSGSFATEYDAHISHRPNGFEHHEHLPYQQPTTSDSHTTPITIVAEQGLIGLAVYLALLVGGGARVRRDVLFAALFAAVVVDTMFYAGFLEDPATWVILALGATFARATPADGRQCSPT